MYKWMDYIMDCLYNIIYKVLTSSRQANKSCDFTAFYLQIQIIHHNLIRKLDNMIIITSELLSGSDTEFTDWSDCLEDFYRSQCTHYRR